VIASKVFAVSATVVIAAVAWVGCSDEANEDGGQEIYVAPVQGGEPQKVETGASLQQLTWSPDSERFAFFSEDPYGGPGDLHIVDPTSPKDAVVVPVPGNPHQISFSPSGERIAVVYFANGGPVIGLTTRDGSDLKTAAELPAAEWFRSLIWLDEDTVLVEEPVTSQSRFVTYDVTSGERFQYDASPGFIGPVLSPDGTRVAWGEYCSRESPSSGVWVLGLESGELRNVDAVCGHLTGLDWSPDGSEIAYTAWYTDEENATDPNPETSGGLYVVNLASGKTRKIADPAPGKFAQHGFDGAVDVGVAWRSDGEGFLVYRDHRYNCEDCGDGRELVLISPDGSEENPAPAGDIEAVNEDLVAHAKGEELMVSSIQQGGEDLVFRHDNEWGFRAAEFSPDGEWIAFTQFHCGDCTIP
jgi:Tol biopolymer transport system component